MTCSIGLKIHRMGRHKEWRKLAKKFRRKRIRSRVAEEKNGIERRERERRENSPSYLVWLKEQEVLEAFAEQEEQRLAEERQKQWEYQEAEDQRRWREQLARLEKARAEKVKQELLIREEWEREQKKINEEKDRKEKEAEDKRKTQEKLLAQIDAFISGKADLPSSSIVGTESQPGQPECPFFAKTGACRFRNHCSRNHIKPGISRTLLFTNFYDNFVINTSSKAMNNEYDTDVGLEYEDSDTYHHFQDFYDDILPEFENCGKIRQLKVCCNYEPHLRGNVYVEYFSKRHALKAYRLFQGRFYAGRQLSVSFTNIPSWKNALCGLFRKQRCPKGKTCNFLHTFRNPFNQFRDADFDSPRHIRESPIRRSRLRSPENWRWSESSEGSVDEDSGSKWDSYHRKEKYRARSRERDELTESRKDSAPRKRIKRKKSQSRSQSNSESNGRSDNVSRIRKSRNKDGQKTRNGSTKNSENKTKSYSSSSSKSHSRTSLANRKKKSEKEERTPGSG